MIIAEISLAKRAFGWKGIEKYWGASDGYFNNFIEGSLFRINQRRIKYNNGQFFPSGSLKFLS